MTKETYLSQVTVLSRRIGYHNERLCRLQRQADAVFSRWGERTAAFSGDAPYVRMLAQIEDAREELNAEMALLSALQGQVEEILNSLPEDRLRLVLAYHYLEGLSFVRIGESLFVDKRTVIRWHRRALDLLDLPEDVIDIFPENRTGCHRLSPDAPPAPVL